MLFGEETADPRDECSSGKGEGKSMASSKERGKGKEQGKGDR